MTLNRQELEKSKNIAIPAEHGAQHFFSQSYATQVYMRIHESFSTNLAKIIPNAIWNHHIMPFIIGDIITCNILTTLGKLNRPFYQNYLAHVILLKQLLQQIAYGEKEFVNTMLVKKEYLLLLRGPIVTDYSGRQIQQTPYQMAIAAGDVSVRFKNCVYQPRKQGQEMAEVIERHFNRLASGQTIMHFQLLELFPEGFTFYLAHRKAEAYMSISKVIEQLRIDDEDFIETEKALLKLNNQFLQSASVISTGMHFHPGILVDALRLYKLHYKKFTYEGNEYPDMATKNLFLWQRIIGLINRYITACDAMVICQGTFKYINEGQTLERLMKFLGNDHYYPLAHQTHSMFGVTHASQGMFKRTHAVPSKTLYNSFACIISAKEKLIAKKYENARAMAEGVSPINSQTNRDGKTISLGL